MVQHHLGRSATARESLFSLADEVPIRQANRSTTLSAVKEGHRRISDLQFFLVFAGVVGIGNLFRSGPALAVLSVAVVGIVILVMRAWTNRPERS